MATKRRRRHLVWRRRDVKFLGYVKNTRQFYEQADIVCVPSFFETFGLVLIEAMSAGKPVAASRISSFSQILDDGRCGRLFDADSPESLAAALLDFLADPSDALRMGALAREHFDARYSASAFYGKLRDFLARVVNCY